jgi:hypothetical protein
MNDKRIGSVTVWRGLVIDEEMPRSVDEYIAAIQNAGCPLGADGGQPGVMRGFQLCVPKIPQHELAPSDAARRVRDAGPNSERYDREDKEWLAICVCGDRGGAFHYATRSQGIGLIVQAEVPFERLTVDGRDFLYSAVPKLCGAIPQSLTPVLPSLKAAFSEIVETYVEAGRSLTTDVQLLFRLVDYMVMDRRVIEGQLASKVDLLGRYKTAFRSAFGVRGGVLPSEIVNIAKANKIDPIESDPPVASLRLSELV